MGRRRFQQKGNLYQQGGFWRLRWREDVIDANGARKRGWSHPVDIGPAPGNQLKIKPLTEKEARRIAWETYLSRLDQQTRTPQSIMTVRQFVEEWYIPGHVRLKKTKENYLSQLNRWVLPALGTMRLRDVRKRDVQALVNSVLAAGNGTQTALHIRNLVSGIFRFAEAEEIWSGLNPAKHVGLPEMVRKERHALTFPQAQALLEAIPECYRLLVMFALLTSLNIAEILGLRWRYVNLGDEWLTVDGESVEPWCFNVRYQWRQGTYGSLKAIPRRRNIPLPRVLIAALLPLRGGPDDPVFPSRTGRPLDAHNILNRHLKPIGRQLGMDWLNWHCLRHTTATWLDQTNAGTADRMAIGGWSQERTMMRYTHADQERRRQFLEEIAAKLVGEERRVQ